MTASTSSPPPPIEITGMILFASYEQTAITNGWDVSSNEEDGDNEQMDDEEVDTAIADIDDNDKEKDIDNNDNNGNNDNKENDNNEYIEKESEKI
eukprot:419488_1